jgi:outer membrane protein, heavy metal efflux system
MPQRKAAERQLVDCEGSRQRSPRWLPSSLGHADDKPSVLLRPLILAVLGVALAACGAPTDLPLPTKPGLADSVSALHRDGINIASPLTVTQVALLAVQNNPDLLAVRAQHGVARAQVLQAGVLPNPQFTGAFLPLVAGVGTTPAYNAGLSEDIRALITLSSSREAARANAGQVDAQILWQEWQVIGQARLLAVDLIGADRSMALLARNRDLLAARYRKSQRAVAAGNETLSVSAPDLAALQTTTAQINDLKRQQLARRHQLNALLGLSPDVAVRLDPAPDLPAWNPDAVEQALPTLAERRPDLVALQLGYRAQNAKLRTAILSRFPNLVLGVTGGSDNANVRNLGPQITLELPIFNQNQGNIAIETATRQQLHDEYAARLTAAFGQVRAMMTEIDLLSRQLSIVRQDLAGTRRVASQAEAAFDAGNLDERSYVDLVAARLTKEQEIVTIEQSLLDQQVAIATLLGAGMPAIAIPSGDTQR